MQLAHMTVVLVAAAGNQYPRTHIAAGGAGAGATGGAGGGGAELVGGVVVWLAGTHTSVALVYASGFP
jgi:hypothetical protein